MLRCIAVFLLFGVFVCHAFAQTPSASSTKAQNLRDCIDAFGTCDQALLTSTQAGEIANLQHDHNLWVCLTGNGECDHSMLYPRDEAGYKGRTTAECSCL